MTRYDVAVVGLGAYGSAATWQLAKRGARVLGIDRFSPPHALGSTHGESRITRMAVGEGLEYSPIALRSRLIFKAMEKEIAKLPGHADDAPLFNQCGCLTIFGPGSVVSHHGVAKFFENIARAAKKFGIKHKEFHSADALRAAYPQFAVADTDRGFLDLWGGFLRPEACVAAALALAEKRKADIRRGVTIKSIESSKTGVTITAEDGETFEADRVLVAAGPWLPGFVPASLRKQFKVTRQVLNWFEINSHPERFAPENCPVFIWDVSGRKLAGSRRRPKAVVYGFPLGDGADGGLKVTHEEPGPRVDPDRIPRDVTATEIEHTYSTYVKDFLPDLGPRSMRTATCMYTSVAGGRFVIDAHPDQPRVMVVSACSGHGFKHSAAVGEALAEKLSGQKPAHVDLAPFTLKRLERYLGGQ
jgi:sarcosine oxidase